MQGYGQYNVPKITFYTYSLNTNNISYFYIKKTNDDEFVIITNIKWIYLTFTLTLYTILFYHTLYIIIIYNRYTQQIKFKEVTFPMWFKFTSCDISFPVTYFLWLYSLHPSYLEMAGVTDEWRLW